MKTVQMLVREGTPHRRGKNHSTPDTPPLLLRRRADTDTARCKTNSCSTSSSSEPYSDTLRWNDFFWFSCSESGLVPALFTMGLLSTVGVRNSCAESISNGRGLSPGGHSKGYSSLYSSLCHVEWKGCRHLFSFGLI